VRARHTLSCEFPGQKGNPSTLSGRDWDSDPPVIRAINIPNNVLLLPFLPAAFSLLLHLALLRVPIGILALASVWLGLASSHPGQLTPREN